MGIDFRDGKYTRRVNFGKRTVKEGEAVAIWDRYGRHRQVIGPKLVYLYYSTIRFLDRHIANEHQYVVVEKTDGSVAHLKGPCTIWENPTYHRKVQVQDLIQLFHPSECIIVIEDCHDKLLKQAVFGPISYMPKPQERIHTFSWINSSVFGLMDSFEKLPLKHIAFEPRIPIRGDVFVTFSLTFLISDPIHLVNNVVDPRLVMLDALRADAITIESVAIVENIGSKMEGLRNIFPRLFTSCEQLSIVLQGFILKKVELSEEAKKTFESKANGLAQLELTENNAKMKMRIASLELEGESMRAEKKNEFEVQELERKLDKQRREHEVNAAYKNQTTKETVEFLKQLKSLDVDLTKFLCDVIKSNNNEAQHSTSLQVLAQGLLSSLGDRE